MAVLHGDDPQLSRAAEAVTRAWAAEGGRPPTRVVVGEKTDAALLASRLKQGRSTAIVFLGAGPARQPRRRARPDRMDPLPARLQRPSPAPTSSRRGRPRSPDLPGVPLPVERRHGRRPGGIRTVGEGGLARRDHLAVRLAALASLKLLTEGLTRGAGREVEPLAVGQHARDPSRLRHRLRPAAHVFTQRPFRVERRHVLVIDLGARRLRPAGGWVASGDEH